MRISGLKGRILLWGMVVAILSVVGCGGDGKEDPILRLSADEALAKGQELMEKKKYSQAAEYFSHAFEVAPNSATGREALLLAADSFFLNGGTSNFIKAESKYQDFLNRFPTSDRADYVQFQVAKCLREQMLKPDRDQTATRKALVAYETVQQLYPTSDHLEEVRAHIEDIRQNLAEHEYRVGWYNYRRRIYPAAISRLVDLSKDYPDYREMDKVIFVLGMSFKKMKRPEEAAATFDELRSQYPDSPYRNKIPGAKKQT